MSPLFDLHTHSDCSDGALSPSELVRLAIENQVDVLSLTDHDTIAGVDEARAEAHAAGDVIRIIAGIEFSSVWRGRNIHVVGLNVVTDSPILQTAVQKQALARSLRAQAIADKLAKVGMPGALEGARQFASGDDAIGRPHFARFLVEQGHVSSIDQAFKRYLGSGKLGDVKQQWPELSEVVAWITASGGTAVLAHPDKYKLTRTKLYELLDDFKSAGGEALEVVSGHQQDTVTSKLIRAALDYSLLVSCGSDFHSPENQWQSPGKMASMPSGYPAVWDRW